jgi:ubiquinone/menaquinone biosynthesis C-methylase UbiE
MSWFFATFYDPFMRKSEAACLAAWRQELLGGLSGVVAEIGAGTGANLPHYPASVERVTLTEPDASMRHLLEGRRDSASVRAGEVQIVDAPAEALPFDSGSLDAVVTTLVLCTVPRPEAALAEIRRVLRPGGALVFLEHGAAEEGSSLLRWQRRLEPAWRRFAEGCILTRRPDATIASAGFAIETLRRDTMRKAWPILRPTVRGLARKPLAPGGTK